jgi:hypothetical protein
MAHVVLNPMKHVLYFTSSSTLTYQCVNRHEWPTPNFILWNVKNWFITLFYKLWLTHIPVFPNSFSRLHVNQICVVLTQGRDHKHFKAYLHIKKHQEQILSEDGKFMKKWHRKVTEILECNFFIGFTSAPVKNYQLQLC